jgi:photosystem II stability/assembly factor-like uncharacterized protein
MKRLPEIILSVFFLTGSGHFAANAQTLALQKPSCAPYYWKSVQIVGGGFVDGIVFHPTEKGLCYCRTDIGGAYRRDPNTLRWEPLMDWVPDSEVNLMGVESIALDPSDPNRLYLACGMYTNPRAPDAAVLRSNDQGKTFQRTELPFKMGGNENGRGNGERMAVDPNDGKILYLGTRQAGLWKSTDSGASWSHVESFPDVTEKPTADIQSPDSIRFWQRFNQGDGIVYVLFDRGSGSGGKPTPTIYVGVSLMDHNNLFRTTDAGNSWEPVPGQPTQYRPTRAALASDGTLYLAYGTSPGPSRMTNGGVWKFNTNDGKWTDITPEKPDPDNGKGFGYAAVSVDAQNPMAIIASSFSRPGGDNIFRSTDGGKTWRTIFDGPNGGKFDFSLAPYVARTPIHWLFDIEIDPTNPDHAMFTTGYGGYETFDLTDADKGKPTKSSVMTNGVEETVALDLLSPPAGAHLISGIGDYSGFVHWDLDKPEPEGNFDNPSFGNTSGLACAFDKPNIIVRVGRATNCNPGKNIGYSLDGGKTWEPTTSMPTPQSSQGSVAVSSDGGVWVWSPDRVFVYSRSFRPPQPSHVYFTRDRGTTWTQCKGIPDNTRVIADPLNQQKFYAMDLFEGKLFISTDGGANFGEQPFDLQGGLPKRDEPRGDSRGGQDRIYATPGREGDLWIAAFDGLYHSTDAGRSFMKLNGVDEISAFGFGKGAPGSDYPALYLVGTVDGVRGVFRSDNMVQSWVCINDNKHQWGSILQITGDPRIYGRAYVGTHGRGIFYGDPVESQK